MSRDLGWVEHHLLSPDDLRVIADALEALDHEQPQLLRWSVDVVAPQQVWDQAGMS